MKRQVLIPIMAVVLYLVPFLALTAGGGCASRGQIVSATLGGLNTARDTFVSWDLLHQTSIVADAPTKEEAQTALTNYRASREKVKLAFAAAYGALTVASLDSTDASVARAVDAVGEVVKELQVLGVIQ